jgi:tetratricopeptide (TPR) repeat protein
MPRVIALALIGWSLLAGPALPQRENRRAEAAEHLRVARSLFDQRKFAEAATAARRARESDPGMVEAWKLSGLALQLARRLPQARQEFIAALERFPDEADLWFYLARVQYLQSELGPAEQTARQALKLAPDHADAHAQLGMILEALLKYEPALEHYRRAIELNQKQSRPQTLPLVYASQLLDKLGRYAEALEYLTMAVRFNPRSSEIRLARGRILEKLGRRGEAEEEYQQAVALDGNARAQSHLARLRSGTTARPDAPRAEPRLGPNRAGTGGRSGAPQSIGPPVAAAAPIRFRNVAASARLNFTLRNGATPNKYQVETMPGGVAVLDYNNDGYQDIYFTNGAELPAMRKTSPAYWNRLFRNNRDGTFTDVTIQAKVAGEGYAMGVAVADYDNDGHEDIFVAGVNQNILFRNLGDGSFSDVTAKAGLSGIDPARGKMWSVAAAWLDYDNDGHLDIFVVNYCKWHPSIDPYCGDTRPGYRTYCFPDRYEGLPNQLFHNNGDGTFTDVSQPSGIGKHIGKGMGVAVADYNDDGFIDIFVANDTLPNFLFLNDGRGSFQEVGVAAGVALNDTGAPVSSMGVDFRDYDNDGRPDLIITALEGETFPVFRNLGKGFFADETYPSRLGMETIKRSGWGLGLFDFNNDGFKDLFTANAHVIDNIELFNEQTYRQPNSVFANLGDGQFAYVSRMAGPDLQARGAHRGCAFADFNNDGRMDVVTTALNEPAALLLNESPNDHHWLTLRLIGTQSNRSGIGAQIKLVPSSGMAQYNHVTTSVGYASSSDARVHFGLGKEKGVRSIEIRWPSGTVQILRDVAIDRILTVREPDREK